MVGAIRVLERRGLAPPRAEIAYEAEHDEVCVRCGRKDQVAAPLSRAGHALLFETGDDRIRYVLRPCRPGSWRPA